MTEQQLFDLGFNFLRADFSTIPGVQIPYPYGGKQRQIEVDIDPQRLYAWGLSPRDVSAALGLQNVVLPGGSAKIGAAEYPIIMNSSPEALDELGAIPIRTVNGRTIFVRDVANVRDGAAPQQSIVHVGGKKAALMTILKNGSASTLEVVDRVREMLPTALNKLPKEFKVSLLFDQSLFVRASVEGVVKEALIAAGLTALMILLFLGSWRSTLVVVVMMPVLRVVSTSSGKKTAEWSEGGDCPSCFRRSSRLPSRAPRPNIRIGTPARPKRPKSSPPIEASVVRTFSLPSIFSSAGRIRPASFSSLKRAGVPSPTVMSGASAPYAWAMPAARRLMAAMI